MPLSARVRQSEGGRRREEKHALQNEDSTRGGLGKNVSPVLRLQDLSFTLFESAIQTLFYAVD